MWPQNYGYRGYGWDWRHHDMCSRHYVPASCTHDEPEPGTPPAHVAPWKHGGWPVKQAASHIGLNGPAYQRRRTAKREARKTKRAQRRK